MPEQKVDVKHMPISEFREKGWIQEINRRLLHPAGLALEVTVEDDGAERISGVWDYRDDPEGIYFAGEYGPDADKAMLVDTELDQKATSRQIALGYVVQPVEGGDK